MNDSDIDVNRSKFKVMISDGVLEDMSLALRVLEDTFSSPWLWPCEIFNDTYMY